MNDGVSRRALLRVFRAWRTVACLLVVLGACERPPQMLERGAAASPASESAPAPEEVPPVPRQLVPFREAGQWGYRTADGRVVIEPHYDAAGEFVDGSAAVQRGGEYFLIDEQDTHIDLAGAGARGALPLPSRSCASLAAYTEELGVVAGPYALASDASEGESRLLLEVRALKFGAVRVTEHGWEGTSEVLVLPHVSVARAREIVGRILVHVPHRDVTASRLFESDVVTWEVTSNRGMGEYYGISERAAGGVEIHHTVWAG